MDLGPLSHTSINWSLNATLAKAVALRRCKHMQRVMVLIAELRFGAHNLPHAGYVAIADLKIASHPETTNNANDGALDDGRQQSCPEGLRRQDNPIWYVLRRSI